jgi:hypothetical protein
VVDNKVVAVILCQLRRQQAKKMEETGRNIAFLNTFGVRHGCWTHVRWKALFWAGSNSRLALQNRITGNDDQGVTAISFGCFNKGRTVYTARIYTGGEVA